MNGYSRIRSKSIDLAQLPYPSSQTPKQPTEVQEHKHKQDHGTTSSQEEDGVGEIFGVILERSRSVSSALPSQCNLKLPEKRQSALVLQRTFSMRRSSSTSGGYCRIHHQSDFIADDRSVNLNILPRRSAKKRGNILKACMRLLGL